MQLEMGSATVPVAAVGVSPAAFGAAFPAPNGSPFLRRKVFGQRPKTAGATPAFPKTTASLRPRIHIVGWPFSSGSRSRQWPNSKWRFSREAMKRAGSW